MNFVCRFNPKWVLKPWWRSYFYWLWIVSSAVMYNLLVIFPRAVFEQMETDATYRIIWITFDYFCDILYLCDMVVNFLTGTIVGKNADLKGGSVREKAKWRFNNIYYWLLTYLRKYQEKFVQMGPYDH